MQFARLNDVLIHYQLIGGPKDRPVLVFSNSLGTDFRIWRDVVVRLAGDFPIVNYDKRGHGLSGLGMPPYRLEDHAGDLAALLDHLDIRDCIIVGLSVGGMVAQLVAAQRRDLVRALVLCDTAPKIGEEAGWNERIEAIQIGGMDAIADAVMERWFTAAFREAQKDSVAGYRNMLTRTPLEGYAGTCAAIRDADLSASTGGLEMPVSCVAGDQDRSTPPELVGAMARLIAGARYDIIPDCGHIPCVEKPAILADLIRSFAAQAAA